MKTNLKPLVVFILLSSLASATLGGVKADSPLYGLVRSLERVGEAIGLISVEKAFEYRATEYEDLARKNMSRARPELASEVDAAREKATELIQSKMRAAEMTNKSTDDLKVMLRQRKMERIMTRHLERLRLVRNQIPVQAQNALDLVINKTEARLVAATNQSQGFVSRLENRTQRQVGFQFEGQKEKAVLTNQGR